MKKLLLICLMFGLAACNGLIENENGSERLKQLEAEPVGCVYLYKVETEISVYDSQDARRYLENTIVDKARGGNAYLITSERTRPNEWTVFGPERAFVLAANVYNCPFLNDTITAKNADKYCSVSSSGEVIECR